MEEQVTRPSKTIHRQLVISDRKSPLPACRPLPCLLRILWTRSNSSTGSRSFAGTSWPNRSAQRNRRVIRPGVPGGVGREAGEGRRSWAQPGIRGSSCPVRPRPNTTACPSARPPLVLLAPFVDRWVWIRESSGAPRANPCPSVKSVVKTAETRPPIPGQKGACLAPAETAESPPVCANIAQLVEQRFRKAWVVGSNPTVGSTPRHSGRAVPCN